MALSDCGGRAPLAKAGDEGAFGRGGRAGPRVVEGQERRRATERRRRRVLEEPVGLGVGRHPGVGVHVDRAGQDEQPGRIDRLARGVGQTRQSPARWP